MSLLLLFGSGDNGAGGYPMSFASLGIVGATGWVIDGTQPDTFFTDSALTTPCVTSGSDPVGGITDLSGNDNPLIQSTSPNKCVYIVNGGVSGYKGGTISGNRKWMEGEVAFSQYHYRFKVYKREVPGGAPFTWTLDKTTTPPDPVVLYFDNTSPGSYYAYDAGSQFGNASGSVVNIGSTQYARTSTGANGASVYIYNPDGSLVGTGTGTHASTYSSDTWVLGGDPAFDRQNVELYFDMAVDGVELTTDQINTILAYMDSIAAQLS